MLFEDFDWDLTHQVLVQHILPSHHMNLRHQPWRLTLLWYRIDIFSCKLSAKVSLMLDNPFPVASCLFVNWAISVFVSSRLAQKSPANSLFPSQGKQCFLWSHPWCSGLLSKFQHIKISIKTAHVSRPSVSCDYEYNYIITKNLSCFTFIMILRQNIALVRDC